MMTDQDLESNRVAGLEFLWMVTDARSDHGSAFLRQSQLLFSYMDLLMDDSRLVRSRALDILSILLESTANPLSILGKDIAPTQGMELDKSDDQAMVECFNYLLDHDVYSLIILTDSLKALHVATGILDAMIKPLRQSEEMHGIGTDFKDTIVSVILWILQALQENTKGGPMAAVSHIQANTIIVQGKGKLAHQLNQPGFQSLVKSQSQAKPMKGASAAAARGGTLSKTIVLSALKALQSLALLFPETVEKSAAIHMILLILLDQKLCSDQRVFKACLTALPIVLKTKIQDGQLLDEQLFANAMMVILGLLQRQSVGSTSVKLILTAILEFFADNTIGSILSNEKVGLDLANALGLKLYDMEWDVRDNVIEFIGTLFRNAETNHGVDWALKHDLLEVVFQKLSDEEAYVRATSIYTFESIMRHPQGWKRMCGKNLDERLSSQLPSLIQDSEAFVRRAVLEAMICLVTERDSDDSDWEVRIRACEFIAAIWSDCMELSGSDSREDGEDGDAKEGRSTKRQKDSHISKPSSSWFFDIRGDRILVEAALDSSRLVRLTSVETLKQIKVSIEKSFPSVVKEYLEIQANNNSLGGGEDKGITIEMTTNTTSTHLLRFYTTLMSLNFERLDATTSREQLYEEVLDVERVEDVVMEESENRNDVHDMYLENAM
ncbi:BRCA1-associated ATM activator 1 [Lobosporangium transversale]|nr:BRCA1-associated ATM activator 1 [Lobosporangium transversale]